MENIIIRETSSEIRTISRSALRDNAVKVFWGVLTYIALASFVPLLLDAIIPGITNPFDMVSMQSNYYGSSYYDNYEFNVAGALYELFIGGAFELGLAYFMISFFRNRDINVGYIFNGFEHYLKSLGLFLMMGLLVLLWSLLLIVPGIIAAIRYSQCFFILADNPKMGIMECIRESKRLMTGNKGKYFCLSLSFIGWALLAGLAVFILSLVTTFIYVIIPTEPALLISSCIAALPSVVVLVYMKTALTVFYELVSGKLVAIRKTEEENYNF